MIQSVCTSLKDDPRTCHGVLLFDGRLEYLGRESVIKYLNTQGGCCSIVVNLYLVHGDISHGVGFIARVGQEQEITSIEGWFHRSTIGSEHMQGVSALHTSRTDATKANSTYLRTTTIGLSVLQMRPRPFHIISPDAITFAKFNACSRACAPCRKSGLHECW
jgi:hypothetical protein